MDDEPHYITMMPPYATMLHLHGTPYAYEVQPGTTMPGTILHIINTTATGQSRTRIHETSNGIWRIWIWDVEADSDRVSEKLHR